MSKEKDDYIEQLEAENELLRSIIERCGITEDNISEFKAMGFDHTIRTNDAFNMYLRLKKKDE